VANVAQEVSFLATEGLCKYSRRFGWHWDGRYRQSSEISTL